MGINKHMRAALKLLSYPAAADLDKVYRVERALYGLKAPPLSRFYHFWDHHISSIDGTPIRVRIYTPKQRVGSRVLVFFHGGGWVFESIDTYDLVCRRLAKATGCIVASVDYRRAPEFPFPVGLEDCYAAAQAISEHRDLLGVQDMTLIGDSAGGNLAAAVSLMARDRATFSIKEQILIYPATGVDHSETSPFASVHENGEGYLLTARRIQEFMRMYAGQDDSAYQNPYFAPLLMKDLHGQPRTLVITAQYDPLRDEGEAYAQALACAGNLVTLYRMPDALHGFFSLPARFVHVQRTHTLIRDFLGDEQTECADENKKSRTGTDLTMQQKSSPQPSTVQTPPSFD